MSRDARARALAALLVAAAGLAAGCADGSQSPPPAERVQREVRVDPGSFFEANLAMDEGDELAYAWRTLGEGPVAFDVHSHEGSQVTYHERANGSAGEGGFRAPGNGTYSLLWANDGRDAVTVNLSIEGAFAVESFAPQPRR